MVGDEVVDGGRVRRRCCFQVPLFGSLQLKVLGLVLIFLVGSGKVVVRASAAHGSTRAANAQGLDWRMRVRVATADGTSSSPLPEPLTTLNHIVGALGSTPFTEHSMEATSKYRDPDAIGHTVTQIGS